MARRRRRWRSGMIDTLSATRWPEADPRWPIALHEASHATVAICAADREVAFVTLRPHRTPEGRVRTGRVQLGPRKQSGTPECDDYAELIVAFAGAAAQMRAAPGSDYGAVDDDERAQELARRLALDGDGMREAVRFASEMVARCWSDIEAVAAALLGRESLTGEDVDRIIKVTRIRQRMEASNQRVFGG